MTGNMIGHKRVGPFVDRVRTLYVVEVQMHILLFEASFVVFRCAKSLFRASLVVKMRDLVEFRAVVEFLVRVRRM